VVTHARPLTLSLLALVAGCERLGFPPPFQVDPPVSSVEPWDAAMQAITIVPPPVEPPRASRLPEAPAIPARLAREREELFAAARVASVRAVRAPGYSVDPDHVDARTHLILGRRTGERRTQTALYDLANDRVVGSFGEIDWSSEDNRVHTLRSGDPERRSLAVLTVADQREHSPRVLGPDGRDIRHALTVVGETDGTVYVIGTNARGEHFAGPWNPLEGDVATARTMIPFRPRTYVQGGPERGVVLEPHSWLDGFVERPGRACVGVRLDAVGGARCVAWGELRPEWVGWNNAVLLGDYAYSDEGLPAMVDTVTGRQARGPMTEGHCQTVKKMRVPPRAIIACAGVGEGRALTDWYWWAPGQWRFVREPEARFNRIGDSSQTRARLLELQTSSNGPTTRWIDLREGTLVDHRPLQEVMFQSGTDRWGLVQHREADGSLSLFVIDAQTAELTRVARRTDCASPGQFAVEAQSDHRFAIGCFAPRAPGLFSFIVRWSAVLDVERRTLTPVPGQVVELLANGETLVAQAGGRWIGESDFVARELRRVRFE
jgi:hypothetical protein